MRLAPATDVAQIVCRLGSEEGMAVLTASHEARLHPPGSAEGS